MNTNDLVDTIKTGDNVSIILKRRLSDTLNDNWEEIEVNLKLIDPTEA